jgi:hypothetical protein
MTADAVVKARPIAEAGREVSDAPAAGSPRAPATAAVRWTADSPSLQETAAANDAKGSAPAGASPTSSAAHAAANLPRI